MIIKSFELFKFQIPLKYPLKISKASIKNREGFILKLIDDKKNIEKETKLSWLDFN